MILPQYFQPLRVRLSILFVFTFSVILTQIPLFNYLGYEFSVAVAICMCVTSGFLTIGDFRSQFKSPSTLSEGDFYKFQKRNIVRNPVHLIVPLLVITLNFLAVKNCSYLEGLGFYILIPLVTVLFCTLLAGLCCVLFQRPRLWYAIFVFLILAHILWLGYFTPQIYSYNLILGFFPGLSYDEVLTITSTLLSFRIITLVVAAFCFLLSLMVVQTASMQEGWIARWTKFFGHLGRGFDIKKVLFLVTTVVMIVAWTFRVELGFESSYSMIEHTLDRVIHTDHFTIRYAAGSFSDDEVEWVANEHEFRFHQVAQKLQVSLNGTIASYIYPTEESMRRSTGTASTNFAKPWRREMHLNKDSWQHVLKHELVHILAGEFGMPIIRAHYNIGLVEGLAMAVEWDFGNRTPHEYAASLEHFGQAVDVAELFSITGFVVQAPTVSYVVSGSFCRFLADRYGLIRLKEVYKGRSFTEVYGKNDGFLIEEWKNFLKRIPVENGWEPHVQFYFNRKHIFAKECARHIALLNEQGARELKNNNPAGAMEVFGASLRESWNSEAFAGFIRSAYRVSRFDTVTSLMKDQTEKNFYGVANLFLIFGDAHWKKGDLPRAKTTYEDILRVDLSESFTEAATLRLAAMEHPELRGSLQPFFVNPESDSAKMVLLEKALQVSDHPVLHVLAAQQLSRLRDYKTALQSLDRSKDSLGDPTLSHLREKLGGLCNFYLRRYQQARTHFWQAMNYTKNEASILRLHEWIDRCEWFEDNKKSKN